MAPNAQKEGSGLEERKEDDVHQLVHYNLENHDGDNLINDKELTSVSRRRKVKAQR